jgi:FAD/FMN-containing dehydrogenase
MPVIDISDRAGVPALIVEEQMSSVLIEEFDILRDSIAGELHVPGDLSWDAARTPWNLAADQHPAAVVIADSAEDVAETVRFASERGYGIAAQGTGHAAATLAGRLDETILVRMHRLRGVEIDPRARGARAEAGALWMDVTSAAAEHGLAALAGSSPDVGVVGYTLGGGLSWLSRTYGIAANSVTAIEVVTADGELVRADSRREPELFWALRGGGGNFGVVTAIEFTLYPVTEVYAGVMFWPIGRAAEVLQAWRELVPTVPESMTTVGRLLMLPPIPEIPEPLRGRRFVVVEAIHLGDEEEGADLLAPLRALEPEMDTVRTIAAAELSALHMDPEHPVPGAGDGMMLDDVTAETIDALADLATSGAVNALLSVELRQLGGAIARPMPGQGAVGHFEAGFAMFAIGIAPVPEAKRGVESALDQVTAVLEPSRATSGYINFAERPTEIERLYSTDVHRRLREMKRRFDPDGLFRSNHPIEG